MRGVWKVATTVACATGVLNCSAAGPGAGSTGAADPAGESAVQTASAAVTGGGCGLRYVSAKGDGSPGNMCLTLGDPCASIGQAVAAACPGDPVFVGAGTFVENVVVDKPLTIFGLGEHTVVRPAVSNPDPCSDSSLCGGAASNVILVRASHVTLGALAIDGDNPGLASGVMVRGADIDARNGVITDDSAVYDDLTVVGVSVRNVYFRGIDATSGGTFRFEANQVDNLSSDTQAIGIFETGGSGTMSDNVVSGAPAGLAANFSTGVTIARNRVSGAGGGIHTDNAGVAAGSTPDEVIDNLVSDCSAQGFGIFAFSPGQPITFRGNRVVGCTVGLAAFGQQGSGQTRFVRNFVDGQGADGTLGVYATTSLLEFGSSDATVLIEGNRLVGTAQGIFVEQQPGFTATANIRCNVILGTAGVLLQSASSTVERNAIGSSGIGLDASALASFAAPRNWWGCFGGPGSPGCSTVTPNVDANPVAPLPPVCTLQAPF